MSSPVVSGDVGAEPVGTSPDVQLTIELGQTILEQAAAEQLRAGALLSLDEFADDPVTIYCGSKLVGRGEVILIEGQLGVRITELYGSVNSRE